MILTRTAAVDGGRVAWDVAGTGPPVVLVHGFPGNSYLWRDVVPVLARAGHRVYVYDLLGSGASEQRDGQDLYFAGQARVLDALLSYWELERPAVVAHDMGTGAAVLAATAYRRPVDRLVLISAAISTPAVTGSTLHVRRYLEAYASMPAATWAPLIKTKIATATRTAMNETALEVYVRPWLGEKGQAAYLRLIEQIDEDVVEATHAALESLDMPVRVIWGEEDTWLPVEQAERIHRRIPDADLRLVPGGGHFLSEDAPGAVGRLLVEFLAATR